VSPVELQVGPRHRDLVGFRINRVWPTARRRLIGPFIFYDHMLHRELPPGEGLDVPPHPHIGLATVTYLFSGSLTHRDSLGTQRDISPGDLNWMIAGRGITHSERTSNAERAVHSVLHGTQAWVALPRQIEDCPADFVHIAAEQLPETETGGVRIRMLAGSGFGLRSPLPVHSPMHYAEAKSTHKSSLELPVELGQRGAYIVEGDLECGGQRFEAGQLLVFADGSEVRLGLSSRAHLMLFGGEPLTEDRFIWWNFVASTAEAIEAAKEKWARGEFPDVPGDSGAMRMPEF